MPQHEAVELVAYGDDVLQPERPGVVAEILDGLESALRRAGKSWESVSLLMVANSILHSDPRDQQHLDEVQLEAMRVFGTERDWVPPLVGATTLNTFYSSYGDSKDEIRSGLLFVAICSTASRELPVSRVISKKSGYKGHVAYKAVHLAATAAARVRSQPNAKLEEDDIYADSIALLFSTGSAHGDYSMKDDFRDCYDAGVQLVRLADDKPVRLIGGHASNNRPSNDPRGVQQRQVLYFSEGDASAREYRRTDHFGAVCAFVPTFGPVFELSHPYEAGGDAGPLKVGWAESEGNRSEQKFLVESIDGDSVAAFLKRHWNLNDDQLLQMADDGTPIPCRPELHEITLLSAGNRAQIARSWPNVPIWMEAREAPDGTRTPLLRLVRGEESDSRIFLVRLSVPSLTESVHVATRNLQAFGAGASSLSFLCESRRYVLESHDLNSEAWTTTRETRGDATAVGIYVNGEHAAGFRTAIGYHNYSMVNVTFRSREDDPVGSLP